MREQPDTLDSDDPVSEDLGSEALGSEDLPRDLGHYQILSKLGEGGMGVVYVALDRRLGRRVALKVLSERAVGDPERLERFQREARIVAGLSHPNIVTLYSVEAVDGIDFLTMELIDGVGLEQEIARGPMPLKRFFDLAIPLADALSAAHERGIVHRDLKPGNLLVAADDTLTVLDFGIARLGPSTDSIPIDPGKASASTLENRPHFTKTGTVLGTYSYMSPEQAQGLNVDVRSDVFNLGVLFYEMLGGRHPFQRKTPIAMVAAIVSTQPEDLTGLRKNLPPEILRLIRRCLEKDADARFASAAEVYAALQEVQKKLSPAPSWQRLRTAVIAAAAAALIFFGLSLFPSSTENLTHEEPKIDQPPRNLEAYGLYLEGISHWHRRSPNGFVRAIELFEEAIELDPELAEAYASLAAVKLHLSNYGKNRDPDLLAQARAAALRGVEVDPNSSEARAELGFVHWADGRLDTAQEEVRRAIGLDPKNARAHYILGFIRQSIGEPESAIAAWEAARRLDPSVSVYHSNLGETYLEYGKLQKARESFEKVAELDPNWPFITRDFGRLAMAARNFDAAVEVMQLGDRIGRTNSEAELLARVHHLREDYAAELEVARSHRTYQRGTPDLLIREASALIGLGRFEEAEQLFERLEEEEHELGLYLIATEFMAHGAPQQSRRLLGRILKKAPVPQSLPMEDHVLLISLLEVVEPGRVPETIDALLKLETPPRDEIIATFFRSLAHALRDEKNQGIAQAESLTSGSDSENRLDRIQRLYRQAMAFAALGENDRAVRSLGQALEGGLTYDVWIHSDPIWRELYDHPPYRELLRANSLPLPIGSSS